MARFVLTALLLIVTLPATRAVHGDARAARWQALAAAARMPSFYDPSGIAIGPRGSIFVADTGNDRVLKLSPSGRQLSAWPLRLLPPNLHYFHLVPGQTSRDLPTASLAVDRSGAIWVAGGGLGLRKLSPSGHEIGRWSDTVSAVAVNPSGNIYTLAGRELQKRAESGAVVADWAVSGSGAMPSGSPVGLAAASTAYVYVIVGVEHPPDPGCPKGCRSTVAYSVERFSANGALRETWSAGVCAESVEYCLSMNVPMAVESDGRLLIGDRGNDQVLAFSQDGTPAGRWGSRGHGAGQFEGILGLSQTAHGVVIVADAENGRLQLLTSTGRPLAQWGGGTAQGQFLCPSSVAVAPDGTAFVRDINNNRVQRLARNGTAVGSWHVGSPGAASQFSEYCNGFTAGIATDRKGTVYVIQPYDPSHLERYTPDSRGMGDVSLGSFQGTSVAIGGGGNIFVVGSEAFYQLLKLSPSGRVLARWPASPPPPDRAYGYSAVAVDPHGNVYLAQPFASRIIKLSPSMRPLGEWTGFAAPLGLATDPHGNLYVADNGNNLAPPSTRRQAIWKLSPAGKPLAQWWSVGSQPGQIHDPQGVAVDPSARWLYVADTGNNRVQRLWLGR